MGVNYGQNVWDSWLNKRELRMAWLETVSWHSHEALGMLEPEDWPWGPPFVRPDLAIGKCNKREYHAFLQSKEWRVASAALRAQVGRCQVCGEFHKILQLHHADYDEGIVVVLCVPCHGAVHSRENSEKQLERNKARGNKKGTGWRKRARKHRREQKQADAVCQPASAPVDCVEREVQYGDKEEWW
jgi:hypothetical protein